MSKKINFYIPVEVKNRELYAKVLLAKYAAEKGFNVIIGKKNDLNRLIMRMPAGVYMGLGVAENYKEHFQKLDKCGHTIVINEEEGLVTYSDEMYLDMRISSKTLEYVDLLFTWGKENYDILSSGRERFKHKFCISGNPRFDLLKQEFSDVYKDEIDEIKKKYRNFILICTSFPSCNHYIPRIDYVQSLIDKKTLRTQQSIEKFQRYQRVKSNVFKSFLDAIPKIAQACPTYDVVVRPHPSENIDIYSALANKLKNVHVENTFSVHPWMMAASALVHHYCTTSVEAYAIGTPRFALRPERDTLCEKEVPFDCSVECHSVNELVNSLHDCLIKKDNRYLLAKPSRDYSEYVFNIGDNVASELIIDTILNFRGQKLCLAKGRRRKLQGIAAECFAFLAFELRELAGKLMHKKRRNIKSYISHKFDRLSLSEVRGVLDAYKKDDQDELICKMAGNSFIKIYKNDKSNL